MEEELKALHKNKTWHLVPATQGNNLIDCKWVYKADGSIDVFKSKTSSERFETTIWD
jgi:hypothetical protein